jgi:hypothetical protein
VKPGWNEMLLKLVVPAKGKEVPTASFSFRVTGGGKVIIATSIYPPP